MNKSSLQDIQHQAQEARDLLGVLKDFFYDQHEECYKAFKALKFNSSLELFMSVQARVSALDDLERKLLSYLEQEELVNYYTKTRGDDNVRNQISL